MSERAEMNRRQALLALMAVPLAPLGVTPLRAWIPVSEWINFGPGPLAMLHGAEAIVRPEDMGTVAQLAVRISANVDEFEKSVAEFEKQLASLAARLR
jgi:hypothetical protein